MDISIPNLNGKLFLGDNLFIIDVLQVSIRNSLKILYHIGENFNFLLDNCFILFDKSGM
jgi:hypothetical protein